MAVASREQHEDRWRRETREPRSHRVLTRETSSCHQRDIHTLLGPMAGKRASRSTHPRKTHPRVPCTRVHTIPPRVPDSSTDKWWPDRSAFILRAFLQIYAPPPSPFALSTFINDCTNGLLLIYFF